MNCFTPVPTAARRPHSQTRTNPQVRIGDHERERAVKHLGQAFAQGYLSIPDYESRLDQAFGAHTTDALAQVLGDLPIERIVRNDPGRKAARAAAARRGVRIHLAAYVAASLLMLGIWLAVALTAGAWYFWPVWPIMGMGIGVLSHAIPVRNYVRGNTFRAIG